MAATIETVLTTGEGVTLVGGAPFSQDLLREALAVAPMLVGADGGADRILAQGLVPKAVIGDLDSLSTEGRRRLDPATLHHIAEQDSTDFEKALSRIDAPFVVAVGTLGRRVDHELAAMNLLARFTRYPVLLLGEEDLVFRAPPRIELDLPIGSRLSLFPMQAARGRSTGLRWPIDGIDFAPDGRIGTSNKVTGRVRLEIKGAMLVILPRSARDVALKALTAAR